MDYQKLAQDIVACGVGRHVTEGIWDYWCIEDHITDTWASIVNKGRTAEEFCEDGRVCLALMELCPNGVRTCFDQSWCAQVWPTTDDDDLDADFGEVFKGESLPVAINQACVAAIKGE